MARTRKSKSENKYGLRILRKWTGLYWIMQGDRFLRACSSVEDAQAFARYLLTLEQQRADSERARPAYA